MQNSNIIKSFQVDPETLIKSNYSDSEEIINTLESNLEKGLISEVEFFKSLETVKALDPENERVNDLLEKGAKGEGSRGGIIIGHTKSGKPVYDHLHDSHKTFTPEEHKEAAGMLLKKVNNRYNTLTRNLYSSQKTGKEGDDDEKLKKYTEALKHSRGF